ncbi:MAG TPA: cyclic nucleotide-binding domain-containing protein [Thermoanaerobaculia bacterium]|nr:cyclic nucleotide-binding domain-containing protein [Thermoanaerobaculia bacterium]
MSEDLLQVLGRTRVGRDLPPADLERLAAAGSVREAPDGEVLRREGEPGGSLLLILDGSVEVVKSNDDGRSHVLARLEPGTLLGEMGLLGSAPASATVRCRGPVRLFELPRDRFEALVSAGDAASLHLALAMARQLAERLARMNQQAFELCDELTRELETADTAKARERIHDLETFRRQLTDLNL